MEVFGQLDVGLNFLRLELMNHPFQKVYDVSLFFGLGEEPGVKGIFYYRNKTLLRWLPHLHDLLDVLVLVGGLHDEAHEDFEKLYNFLHALFLA